ncbi:MAG: glycoside hydrolase domain-containing protein [Terracidiphilus sp.]
MQDWWNNSSYQFAGYYLQAPCHAGFVPWEGHRMELVGMGWTLLVIYVGQQRAGNNCGNNVLTQAQGLNDAIDATGRTEAEGFPAGTYIYLDLEGGDPFGPDFADYLSGWIPQIVNSGYGVGFYCSYLLANDVQNFAATQGAPATRFWIAGIPPGAVFNNATSVPSDSSVGFATAWQSLPHNETSGSTTLNIDSSVSTLSDPSAP